MKIFHYKFDNDKCFLDKTFYVFYTKRFLDRFVLKVFLNGNLNINITSINDVDGYFGFLFLKKLNKNEINKLNNYLRRTAR